VNQIIHDEASRCAAILLANMKPSDLPEAHEFIYRTVRIAIETALVTQTREAAETGFIGGK
jgi:hypothetical protein